MRISVFIRIRTEFQCLNRYDQNYDIYKSEGQNSNVFKDKIRVSMFIKIGREFQCWKDKVRMPIFIKIGTEIRLLEC